MPDKIIAESAIEVVLEKITYVDFSVIIRDNVKVG